LAEVIPKNEVCNKLIIDDASLDRTRQICSELDWTVIENEGHGISDGANTALKNVTSPYFCSVEHDVVLSKNWWSKVSTKILPQSVVAVSGVRFVPKENPCHSIERYLLLTESDYGKTLDNTIWDAEMLRRIGGFPQMRNAFCETVLHEKIKKANMDWLVLPEVESLHLRWGLSDELRHYFFYGHNTPFLQETLNDSSSVYSAFFKALKSSVAALKMTKATGDKRLLYTYPLCRWAWFCGYVDCVIKG
jgi:glycosyltransferase involved in cell wall biosynthesis